MILIQCLICLLYRSFVDHAGGDRSAGATGASTNAGGSELRSGAGGSAVATIRVGAEFQAEIPALVVENMNTNDDAGEGGSDRKSSGGGRGGGNSSNNKRASTNPTTSSKKKKGSSGSKSNNNNTNKKNLIESLPVEDTESPWEITKVWAGADADQASIGAFLDWTLISCNSADGENSKREIE